MSAIQPARRGRLLWQLVAIAATTLLLFVLRAIEPMFWFVGDRRNQYVPVAMDIGRRLRDGEFPVIDPDLGPSGNYALDLQYGLYEPTHWLASIALSTIASLGWASFAWSAVYLVILAWGTTCLVLRLTGKGAWAAAAGVGVATSGYIFFYLATSWIPGLTSIAFLPWLWWAWVGDLRPRRCVAIAVFTFLVVGGGWPSTWLAFGAWALGMLSESALLRDRAAGLKAWAWPLLTRVVACAGGAVAAALTALPLAHATEFVSRKDTINNTNFLVPNLADIVAFASPNLNGDLQSFGGVTSMAEPIYFAGWFALPMLWLVQWRGSIVRQPGVIGGAVATVMMLLLTQVPSTLGPLRDPIRQLAGVQLFFVITVVVIVCHATLVVNRRRLVGIGLSLVAVTWLAWARDPRGLSAIYAMVIVAVFVLLLVFAIQRWGPTISGAIALGGTLVLVALAFQLYPLKSFYADGPDDWSQAALTFTEDDRPMFAVYEHTAAGKARKEWFADGVGRGFERLTADTRMAPGYSSVQQRQFIDRFCIPVSHGYTCKTVVERLFEEEPRTGKPWIDLLGYRTLLIASDAGLRQFSELAGPEWQSVDAGQRFVEYERPSPAVAGRVTATIGDADVEAVDVSNSSQTYDVSSEDGATLVFRDLYWPYYRATVDGQPVEVRPLDRMLVTVELPPGTDGELTLTYHPLRTIELYGAPAAAVGLVGFSMLAAHRLRPRPRQRQGSPGVDGERDEDEPADREPLQNPV